ncbi:MAG: hypothetical protein MH472_09930 [Bacteroidia bacterium]|nr:hypothetical protein [Bacteroidia bacterium]
MKSFWLCCSFFILSHFTILGQNVNLYFQTENGNYPISISDSIPASLFSNKTVILKVKNNHPDDTFKIGSDIKMMVIKKDSIQGEYHFRTLEFSTLLSEKNKKILRGRDSQTLLLALKLQKFRRNKLLETIPVNVTIRIKHE